VVRVPVFVPSVRNVVHVFFVELPPVHQSDNTASGASGPSVVVYQAEVVVKLGFVHFSEVVLYLLGVPLP